MVCVTRTDQKRWNPSNTLSCFFRILALNLGDDAHTGSEETAQMCEVEVRSVRFILNRASRRPLIGAVGRMD